MDFCRIDALASVSQGNTLFPTSNNTASQALETANTALATANEAISNQPARRTSGTNSVSIPAADSTLTLTWSDPMPSASYEVHLNFIGAETHPAAYYGFRIVEGTQTVNGCQVSIDNAPSGSSVIWSVTSL